MLFLRIFSRMRRLRVRGSLATLVVTLLAAPLISAAPLITEFMASNSSTLNDEDGDSSDWIEFFNPDGTAVDLGGYYLTDDATNLTKWQFPTPTSLAPSTFLVVFASDKDRAVSGSQLHTNFKLTSNGEYLALVDPDGTTVIDEYAPSFPVQFQDFSYGLQQLGNTSDETLFGETEACTALVPTNGALGTTWTGVGFNDAGWLAGTMGVGYERSNGYQTLIDIDVENQMYNQNTSVYIRVPFNLTNASEVVALTLKVKNDDGFVAYLNGTEVAGARDPANPAWDSAATGDHPDGSATSFQNFNISAFVGSLNEGANVLAIHGLNRNPTSSDMLIRAELEGTRLTNPQLGGEGYLLTPTPGAVNGFELGLPASEVAFSHPSQTFFTTFALSLGGAAAGQTIRYTTDGSAPTATSTAYSSPISISATTQVRAKIFNGEGASGPGATETYLYLNSDIRTFKTNLPIVILDNFGSGRPNSTTTMFMAIIRPDEAGDGLAEITDTFEVATRGTMKVRGSSSSGWPKYSMTIEAWDADDMDQNIEPLDFPREADWVLNSKYQFDRALMRNDLAYRLSNDLGEYAVRTRHVEVINNTGGGNLSYSSDYFGVYSWMEKIKRDNDRVDVSRIDPTDSVEPEVTGGYLFKEDRLDPGDSGFNVSGAGRLAHVYPKEDDITSAQTSWLTSYLNEFDAAVNASNWTHPTNGKHFTEYIKVDAWLKHHWVNTICMNVDGFRLSGYYYKDRNGLVGAGPVWDFDRSMESTDGRDNNPQAWDGTGDSSQTWDDSRYPWWGEALQNPDFRQLHTDLWQRERDGGALSWTNIESIIDGFNAELNSFVANSGGIASTAQARNFAEWTSVPPRNGSHAGEITILKNWLQTRGTWIDSQYTARPSFTVAPGLVNAGTNVSFSGAGGTVYYTIDGTDPRLSGGGISGSASSSTPINVSSSTVIIARARSGSDWSGPIQGTFLVGPLANASNLIITEIHYAPQGPQNSTELAVTSDPSDFEFMELMNVSLTDTIDLTDVHFENGIDFTFTGTAVTSLAPGERVLIVRNQAAFEARYGTTHSSRIAGEFANLSRLDNAGETIQIVDGLGIDIVNFAYNDQVPWPLDAGLPGYSLVFIHDGTLPAGYDQAANWRSSVDLGGNPNGSDAAPLVGNPLADDDEDELLALLEHALACSDSDSTEGHDAYESALQSLVINEVPGTYLTLIFQRNLRADDVLMEVESGTTLAGLATGGMVLHSETNNGDGTSTVVYRSSTPVLTEARIFTRISASMR